MFKYDMAHVVKVGRIERSTTEFLDRKNCQKPFRDPNPSEANRCRHAVLSARKSKPAQFSSFKAIELTP